MNISQNFYHTTCRRQVIVSLRCLERWLDSLPGLAALPSCMTRLCEKVDGFEIQYGHADVLSDQNTNLPHAAPRAIPGWWAHVAPEVFKLIKKHTSNCGHLENLDHLSPRSLLPFARGVNALSKATGISCFTVHPSGVSLERWKTVTQNLAPGICLSIENMSPRSRSFSTLEEMAELLVAVPALHVTLDLCHLLQRGYKLSDTRLLNFVDTYRERIAVAHLSWPVESPVRGVSMSSHTLCTGHMDLSLTQFINSLSPKTHLVIEGDCPPMRDNLLMEEVSTMLILTAMQRQAA